MEKENMKKILVVDNHPVMLSFMTNLLEKHGFELLTAYDGISALKVLEHFVPDIFFIDIVMPNINGEKLCRIIRSRPEMQHAYLVVLSAIAGDQTLPLSDLNINAVIAKGPFNRMSQHVLAALEKAEAYFSQGKNERIAIGMEGISKREVSGELLSSNKHLENLLNNMSEGIFELDGEHSIVFVNATAVFIVGMPEEKLLGMPFIGLFKDRHQGSIKALIEKEQGGHTHTIGEDEPLILNDKRILLNVLRVKDEEREVLTIIMNDISERKRMENQLRQAQRMESIATLAGGIAHQFNNALSVISGNIELLKMTSPVNHDMEYLEPINQSAYRMSNLTTQLLAYARGGKYNPRVTSLYNFIGDTLPLIRHSLDPGINIEIDMPENLLGAKIDLTQMQMVLSGVITNAAEAIEGHGNIKLAAFNTEIEKFHPYLKTGRYACLRIQDDGKGMDEEIKNRIFEPFFTTYFQGRGLGMAAAYGIIQNHGGWISVDSEIGKGTTIVIYLPGLETIPEPEKEKIPELEKNSGVVLIIEDEKMILEVCQTMLEKLGYTVLEAESGEKAIEIVRTFEGEIDLAILDIGLPDMGGEKLFPILKQARENLKVIVCSGYAIDGPAQEILDAGAHGFIQKPYALGTLAKKLQEALAA